MKEETLSHLKRIVTRALRPGTRPSPLVRAIWRMAGMSGGPTDARPKSDLVDRLAEALAKRLGPLGHSQAAWSTVLALDTMRLTSDE